MHNGLLLEQPPVLQEVGQSRKSYITILGASRRSVSQHHIDLLVNRGHCRDASKKSQSYEFSVLWSADPLKTGNSGSSYLFCSDRNVIQTSIVHNARLSFETHNAVFWSQVTIGERSDWLETKLPINYLYFEFTNQHPESIFDAEDYCQHRDFGLQLMSRHLGNNSQNAPISVCEFRHYLHEHFLSEHSLDDYLIFSHRR